MYPQMLASREKSTKTSLSGFLRRRGKILVVTSHLLALDATKHLLEDHLYFVQASRSSELTLQAAREFSPDLIILDTMLPYTLGIELCQQLKADELTGNIPVLFILTSAQPKDKDEIFKAGGTDYLTRPFRSEDLLVRVEIHLTMQRLRTELEIERKEKARLLREVKQWEQFAHSLEEMLNHERSTG